MNVGEWVTVWERELTSLPPFRPITRWTNGRTDGHTRFSAETLNPDTPKRIPITLSDTLTLRDTLTLSDTHYTEWYPDIEGNPLHWVIPITDTPKRIPITLSDTLTLRDTLTLSDTHYTEWYPLRTHPRGYPLHWVIPIPWVLRTHPRVHPLHWGTLFSSQTDRTPSDTHDTEGYLWHWVIPNTLAGKGLLFGRERIAWRTPLKEGIGSGSRPKDRVTFRITPVHRKQKGDQNWFCHLKPSLHFDP
jgi:hypothetical protein